MKNPNNKPNHSGKPNNPIHTWSTLPPSDDDDTTVSLYDEYDGYTGYDGYDGYEGLMGMKV